MVFFLLSMTLTYIHSMILESIRICLWYFNPVVDGLKKTSPVFHMVFFGMLESPHL